MMIAVLVTCALIGAEDAGAAEQDWLDVSARAEIPDGGLSVGQPFKVIIEATHAPGGIALLPEELTLDQKFAERRAARKHERTGSSAKEIDRYELEVLAFEAGELDLPAIPLAYGSTRADTKPIPVDVSTGFAENELPIATSTRPEAIAELDKMAAQDPAPTQVLVRDYLVLWIAGGTLVALLAGLFIWRWLKSREKAEADAGPPPPPPRPAHEVALERLEKLRTAHFIEKGQLKPFYVELSAILRQYAGARWGFDSLDLTVFELMDAIARVPSADRAGLDTRRLEELLEASDMVKFAKFTPAPNDAAAALEAGFALVNATRPPVEESRP